MTLRMIINEIALEHIALCEANPNRHSDEKIATLAKNIDRFGLLHPITVSPISPDSRAQYSEARYEITAGEGRYRAFRLLKRKTIPAVVMKSETEFECWGRRLSENMLRSFDWQAECLSLAEMKADGESAKGLAKVFGLSPEEISRRCAVGEVLKRANIDLGLNVELKDVSKHVLPLRVSLSGSLAHAPKGKKHFQPSDPDSYDYTETTAALQKLVSSELTRETLPAYSLERRLEIAEKQRERLVEEAANAKTWEAEAKAQKAIEREQQLQARHVEETEKLKAKLEKQAEEYRQQIELAKAEVKKQAEQSSSASEAEAARLRENVMGLQQQVVEKEGRVMALEDEIKALRPGLEKSVRKELEEKVKSEVQADVNADYEEELKRQQKEIEVEKRKNAAEADRIKRDRARLEKMHAEIEDHKKRTAELSDMTSWLREFNRRAEEFIDILGIANSYKYWSLMDAAEFKRIASVIFGIQDEIQKMQLAFEENGVLPRRGESQ